MSFWMIPAVAFAGVALVVGVILIALGDNSRRVGKRLENIGSDGAAVPGGPKPGERGDRFPGLTAALERRGQHSVLEQQLARAGLNWLPSEFVAAWLGSLVVLAIAGWFLYGPLGAAIGIVLGAAGCWGLLKGMESSRLQRFERQLPDALMLISSSLRSGYGFMRAIQAVRDEMGPPISIEFAKVLDETNLGVTMEDALTHLTQRVPLPDLDIAVTAALIQLEVGGNLAEVMEIVAGVVRERHRIRAEVDTLTAEGRLSGIILFALPIAMAVVLTVINPGYMSALFHTSIGHMIIIGGAVLQILGGLVITRMLRFDF